MTSLLVTVIIGPRPAFVTQRFRIVECHTIIGVRYGSES